MDGPQDKRSLWFQVEQDIANLLLDRLESQQITPEQAIKIAKFVVRAIPQQMTDQQMLEIIPKLDDEFTELASVVYRHLRDYDQKGWARIDPEFARRKIESVYRDHGLVD